MNISYDYYKIFYYVGRLGSFTKAANALSNSQPNITRAMNNLEKQIGMTLFIRSKKGVRLTEEGRLLFSRVSLACQSFISVENEIESLKNLESGTITIGVSEIALHEVLLPVLFSFRKKYPKITIKITNQSSVEALNSLKKNLVDFALVTTPLEMDKSLSYEKIKSFKEHLLAGNLYRELEGKTLSIKDLTDYPFISLLEGTATRTYHEKLFLKYGISLEPQISAATTDQILPMVKTGLGLGFVPETMLENSSDTIILRLKEEIEDRSIGLFYSKRRPMSPACKKVVDEIKRFY